MTQAIAMINTIDRAELVNQWIKFADVAPTTQRNYNTALKTFFSYLNENQIAAPTREDVIAFRDSLLESRKPSTVKLNMAAVKLFFKYLEVQGIYKNITVNVKNIKTEAAHTRDALSRDDARKILHSLDTHSLKGKRDKAIIALMMCCGLRSCEIVRANVGDLTNTCGRLFLHVHGKARTDKADVVAIPAAVENLLNDYLQARGSIEDDEPLFTAISNRNHGQRLQTQTISRMTKATFKAAGFNSPRLTCHSCRHTAAVTMLKNMQGDPAALLKIQMVLRHKQISTTQIYLQHLSRLDNNAEDIAAAALL